MIKPIKGKPGRYLNTETGAEISRRQRDKILLGAGHVAAINKQSRARIKSGEGAAPKMARYASLVDHFKNSEALRLGVSPKQIKVKGNSESALLFKATKNVVKDFGKLNQSWKKHAKGLEGLSDQEKLDHYDKFRREFFKKKYPHLSPQQIDKFIRAAFKIVGYREPEFNRYV